MPLLFSHRGVMGAATAAAAPEIFSFSFWFRQVGGSEVQPSQGEMDSVAEAVRVSAATMWGDTNLAMCSNVFLTEVRSYYYRAFAQPAGDPHPGQMEPAVLIGYSDPDAAAVAGPNDFFVPLQTTVAASLSSTGRVKPRFGRFYLPPLGKSPGADGLMSSADAGHVLDAVTDHLHRVDGQLGTILDHDWELIIQSRTGPPGGFIASNPVREVRVGRVIDTQRRRRNALEESYVSESYP